ncbi:MAG: hypothetical protein U1E53_27015 [Dongiaceae bacterium]
MSAMLNQACDVRRLPDDRLPAFVAGHLVVLHQITRASVPLMAAAAARCEALPDDPVCPPLAAYLRRHVEEERAHDEWTLRDLESIGTTREAVLSRIPPASVAALVGAQYYWALHVHPAAILGYIGMLERNAPTPALVDFMKRASGFPDSAFRTMLLHAELDPGHHCDLDRLLDLLPLDDRHERLIADSATHTAECLVKIFAAERSALEAPGHAGAGLLRG